ncbi:MAG TPA: hypothetical protein VE954_13180 [Oligoflexus sp.]|uniref:hypothetical protein n=1 Tax=Oligoflexus sp. TaxID=1971216 RepID=UPI002D533555|nr:hypothetical protein [Oligoflexus sp.]HYX34059.1 hypothetical protein [Oligoflexus sp.]
MKSIVPFTALAVLAWSTASSPARAQMVSTEERFQDLFVTAGYGTAFGAAFGAALLSFQAKPDQNLRFVAIGASVGFIGGSLIGSYLIFSPVFTGYEMGQPAPTLLATEQKMPRLSGLEAQWTVLRF